MARNIGATLSLNNGNFFTNMKSAVSASKNLKSTLSGTSTGMKNFGNTTSGVGGVIGSVASKAAIAISAFAGIRQAVNFGKDVVNTGMQFEQGMANVSAISGVAGSELKKLSEKAKEMGAITKFSALEATDAMSYMGMAGWNSGQMIDGISGIMNLAAASGEELASVSDIVTDSLTAFGLKASDSAEFADVLAVASNKTNTNVAMLGESFKNVAPVAGAMGYSMKDTTAALGIMANAGIKGSDAGTSLRGVMTRLAKPTKEVSSAMSELGISAVNADGSMKPLASLVPELQTKFSILTDVQKGQYATMIAGKNAMSGFLSIVNSSPQEFDALTNALNESDGAAQKMADTMNDTVSGKLTLLKSQFEGVKIAIFDSLGNSQFKNVIQSMTDGLGMITPALSTVSVAIGNGLFGAIQGIYNIASMVFGSVKTAIENNQPAIENLRSAFDNVKNSIVNAFSGNGTVLIQTLANVVIPSLCNALSFVANIASGVVSVASTLSPVIAGIAGAVTTYKIAVTATNVVEGIRNGLIAFSAVMTGTQAKAFASLTFATIAQIAATEALNAVTSAFGAIMTFVTSPIGLVVLAIGAVIAIGVVLYKHWDAIKEWAGNVWGNIKETVSEKLNNIKSAYEEHGGGIKGAAAGAMEAVKGYYTAGFTFLDKMSGGKLSKLTETVKAKLEPMKNAFKGAFGSIKKSFDEGNLKPVLVKMFNNVKTVLSPMINVVSSIWSGIGSIVIAVLGGVKTFVLNTFQNIKTFVIEVFGGIKQNITNFITSIKSAFQNIVSGIGSVFGGVKTIITGVLQFIVGVFTLNTDTIKNSIQTIRDGFQMQFDGIKQIVFGVWEGIVAQMTFAFENVRTIATAGINYVKNQFENIKTTVSGVFSSVWSTISSTFENVKTKVFTVFENVKTTIYNAIEKVKGFFKFDWELPKIKMPHFNITGSFSLNPPATPSFGIDWYAKGGIMTRPTMFGMNGNRGMVGGEAGSEAIVPLKILWDKIFDFADRIKSNDSEKPDNHNNNININIYATDKSTNQIMNELVPALKTVLSNM